MFYQKIVDAFKLSKGDSVWISSELIKLALASKKYISNFDGNRLIDAFQNAVGSEGTILIPTFSFEFSNKHRYDIKNTRCVTGALGNLALKRDDFSRTRHPMHSFAVWGKDRDYLASLENTHSFGCDSPFSYCISGNVKQIMLGTDYVHAFTFVHYAETCCAVPYRFNKKFTGEYINGNGECELKTFDYYARDLNINPQERFNRIGKVLEALKLSEKITVENIDSYLVDLKKSFMVICKDITENDCSNIYDFAIPRNEVFHKNN